MINPLAETTTRVNPYNYALNNPVMFIDPDGRKAYDPEAVTVDYARGGALDFYMSGGFATFGSFDEFVGTDPYAFYKKSSHGVYGGGEDRTPKRDGDPNSNIFRSIGNFFSRLFGEKKSTASGHAVKATIIGFALIPEGEAVLTLEEAMATAGVLSRGLWGLPLMLSGDSGFHANSKPITGIGDIPITTTDSEPEQTMTLFRGVHGKHPDLANAYMGTAIPWGGPVSAEQHNAGDNNSMFTSWSTSIDVANYSASKRGPGGIILKQSFPTSRLSFFDRHGEGEVQVFGPVVGAQKIKPWNPGTWHPYLK